MLGQKFASIKVTCVLLVAFLLLTFWGVLGQAAAGNESANFATERFFESYFLWVLGLIPLPAFKGLAVLSIVHLLCSMKFRMPKVFVKNGWENLGLWGMHVALIILMAGSLVGSELRKEYNGFRGVYASNLDTSRGTAEKIVFFEVKDSLNSTPVEIVEGYPYYIFLKGSVDVMGLQVELYSATYDPLKFVPYTFMVLFLASALFHYGAKVRRPSSWNLEEKNAKGRILKTLVIFGLILWGQSPAYVAETPVLVGERVRPFDSFARGVLDEFCGKVKLQYKDSLGERISFSAVEAVVKIQEDPEMSKKFPLFKVLRNDVAEALDLPEERYVSYENLQKNRSKLELYASRKDNHPASLEMNRLLENVLLFEAIGRRQIPGKVATEYFNSCSLKMEVFYNKVNFALIAFIFSFLGGLFASVNGIFKKKYLDVVANICCGATAAVLLTALILRFYIASRPPLSSLYEIVLLVALFLQSFEFGAFVFCKKRTFTLMIPITILASLMLFFAKFILEPGDLFQPIPAVLNSSVFLVIHVFTIALGFGGMILSGMEAHLALYRESREVQDDKLENIRKLLYGTLVFGAVFTILGTLLGGVWADDAWGRFWGFDPKECGALFVILWAMLLLHLRGGRLVDAKTFALLNSFNVVVTFLCWFGINLLGVGLHSYGFQNGTVLWLVAFVVADVAVIFVLRGKRNSLSAK